MAIRVLAALGFLAVLGVLASGGPANAETTCGPSWAVPGEYYVSGNFRGRKETTVMRLSKSCRIHFAVPGVFSGGSVMPAGQCLDFTFKVQNEPRPLSARWCGGTGTVPWNGRIIEVKVWQSSRQQSARATF